MLSYLQAHSIEIRLLLALVMFSCRQASNKLRVVQVSERNYHWESNYEGNSKIQNFENFVCIYLLRQLAFLSRFRILSTHYLNAIYLY